MQKVVARRVALISETDESLVAQCAALGISAEGGKGELVDRLLRNELGNEAFILYNGGRTGFLGGAPPVPTPAKPAAGAVLADGGNGVTLKATAKFAALAL